MFVREGSQGGPSSSSAASRDSTSVFNAVYCYTSFYNAVVYLHHSLEEKELVDLENSNDAREAKSAFEKADELLITEVQESTDVDLVKLLVLYNKAFSLHMVQKMTTEAMDTLAEGMSILYPNTDGVIIEELPSVGHDLKKYITNLEKGCLETLVCRRGRDIEVSENRTALSLINPLVINPFPVSQKSAPIKRNVTLTFLNHIPRFSFGWYFRLSSLYSEYYPRFISRYLKMIIASIMFFAHFIVTMMYASKHEKAFNISKWWKSLNSVVSMLRVYVAIFLGCLFVDPDLNYLGYASVAISVYAFISSKIYSPGYDGDVTDAAASFALYCFCCCEEN